MKKWSEFFSSINSTVLSVIIFSLFVFTGIGNIIFTKLQNETFVKGPASSPPENFDHPGFQTFLMFVGMSMFLPVFYFRVVLGYFLQWIGDFRNKREEVREEGEYGLKLGKDRLSFLTTKINVFTSSSSTTKSQEVDLKENENENINNREESVDQKKKKERISPLYFVISASADTLKFFIFFGLFYTYASVSEMLKPSVIISTYLLSVFFLKNRVYMHQILGIIIVLIGTVLVASSVFTKKSIPSNNHSSMVNFMGAMFVILGKFFDSLGIILEEKFMKGSSNPPDECIGYEGFFGICLYTAILLVLYLIPGSVNGSVENTPALIPEVFYSFHSTFNSDVFWYIILMTLSIGFYHLFGILISKHRSSLSRTVTDTIRSLAIWIIQILRKRDTYSNFQLTGFLLVLLGNVIFHEILTIPFYHSLYISSKSKNSRYKSCFRRCCSKK